MNVEISQLKCLLPRADAPLFAIERLSLNSGQKLLVTGPSGKGKTTLLHLIAGLMNPEQGYIDLNGQRMGTLNDSERARFRRRHIGVIFQKLNLLNHLTPFENILLGHDREFEPAASYAKRAIQALDDVGLSAKKDVATGVLSLGEQQRIAIARVLAGNKELILADEPTSSLDEANAERVMELLFKASFGKTLIVVSHDLRVRSRFEKICQFMDWVPT